MASLVKSPIAPFVVPPPVARALANVTEPKSVSLFDGRHIGVHAAQAPIALA
jgi:hypothetical protein